MSVYTSLNVKNNLMKGYQIRPAWFYVNKSAEAIVTIATSIPKTKDFSYEEIE